MFWRSKPSQHTDLLKEMAALCNIALVLTEKGFRDWRDGSVCKRSYFSGRPEAGTASLAAGVTGGWELPSVSAGNQTGSSARAASTLNH